MARIKRAVNAHKSRRKVMTSTKNFLFLVFLSRYKEEKKWGENKTTMDFFVS